MKSQFLGSNLQNTAGTLNARVTVKDEELIEAARTGNQQAFKTLVERYEDQVAGVVIGMLGRNVEAEDAGQETFIRFYRSLDKFRKESSLGTYLTRIAVNVSLDTLRKRKRRFNEVASEDAEPELMRLGGSDFQEKAEAQELVYKALARIDPNYKAVIVLRMLEGYSSKETAEILGIPMGTVLSRLKRGQGKLKKVLRKLMDP